MNETEDQRRESRHEVRVDVIRGIVTIGIAQNISRHGLLMKALEEFPIGQQLRFQLELRPDQPLPFTGRVAWHQRTPEGVFVALRVESPDQEWELLVDKVEARAAPPNPGDMEPAQVGPRHAVRLPAWYGFGAADEEEAWVVDVGPAALAIDGPLHASIGTPIFVAVEVPDAGHANLVGLVAKEGEADGLTRLELRIQSADECYFGLLASLAEELPAETPPESAPAPYSDALHLLASIRGRDPFATLGLPPTQDVLVIERAYVQAAQRLNPGRMARVPTDEERAASTEILILLSSAHRTLLDPTCRAQLLATAGIPTNDDLLEGMETVVSESEPTNRRRR